MEGPDLLDPQPIPWDDGGKHYSLAVRDTALELAFQ